jgi:hypothetical protein
MSVIKIIGIVLLILGAVALIFGIYDLVSFNNSTGGKIANKAAGFFGSRTKTVQNCIVQIVIGAVCVAVGFVLYRRS